MIGLDTNGMGIYTSFMFNSRPHSEPPPSPTLPPQGVEGARKYHP